MLTSAAPLSTINLLLVAATCFADEWPDQSTAAIGPDAEKEFAASLTQQERADFPMLLTVCRLYLDGDKTADYKGLCEASVKHFTRDRKTSAISLLFQPVISAPGSNPAKASMAALEKIWHDYRDAGGDRTNPSYNAYLKAMKEMDEEPSATQILIPLQRQGGTFTVPVGAAKHGAYCVY
jgi:hypothetical protein